jgi:hypothetical protein
MRFLLCAAVVAGCHANVRPPAAGAGSSGTPPPGAGAVPLIAILEARGGLFVVDASAGTTRAVPDFDRLDAYALEQRGPFVTCRLSQQYPIDLRNVDDGPVAADELREAAVGASAISVGRDVVIASIGDAGEVRVATVAPRALPDAGRSFRPPLPNLVSLAIAPGGGTLALVASPHVDGDRPQDLFTIRLRDLAIERRTDTGDVYDAAFVDDDHVVMLRSPGAFEVLSLTTRAIRTVAVPAGWETDFLLAYVGWDRATIAAGGGKGSAPLLPLRQQDDGLRRAVFDPTSGRVIPLAPDEQIIAIAPGGDSIVVTTRCHVPGGLVRRWLDGRVTELRARPDSAACAANDDVSGDTPVSAAFSADGRFLVYAMPSAAGWTAGIVDAAGRTRTLRDSARPLVVLGWP